MYARTISPCKDCLNRYIGCHADCELYKAWKAEQDAANAARAYNKTSNSDFNPILRDLWFKKRMKDIRRK